MNQEHARLIEQVTALQTLLSKDLGPALDREGRGHRQSPDRRPKGD